MNICVKYATFCAKAIRQLFSTRTLASLASALVVVVVSAHLTGCQNNKVSSDATPAGFSGSVFGGQQPVSGNLIQLYAVGTAGDGSPATPLISATVTTSDGSGQMNSNANAGNQNNTLPVGSFIITGDYTCPSPSAEVYLVGTGGNPGLPAGNNNTALSLMTALGQCGNLSSSTFVVLNELTTVSTIASLTNFTSSFSAVGSGSSDSAQLQTAFSTVNEYTNTSNGTVPGPTLPTGFYASSTEIQTLGDIVATCVNSAGGAAGDGSACGQLFSMATPSGGPAPTETVGAILNILKQPTVNVPQIYALLNATPPFEPTLTSAPATWNLPIVPTSGTATKLAFGTLPGSVAAGASISPAVTVTVEDSSNNPVTSSTAAVTIAIGTNPGSGTLSGTATVNAVNGVATFPNLSINNVGTGYTLTAASTGLTGAMSSAFNVGAGPANKLAFSLQPSNAASGASIAPAVTVTVEDASGNTVTTSTASVALIIGTNPSSGTLSGTATVNAVNGVATFSTLSINTVGNGYTLAASSTGLTGATSSAFNITPGTATKLAFGTQPSNTASGASITPAVTVTVEDANNNTVTSSTAAVTIAIGTNPGGGALSGTATVNAVSGVATFSTLSINKVGTGYTLGASSAGLTAAASGPFNITPGTANKLAFGTQPSNAASGAAIAPAVTVTVEDAAGNTVTTSTAAVTTAIGTNPAGGALSGTATVNAVSGVATFSTLSINNAGTGYTLIATSAGLGGAASGAFNITAGPANKVVFSAQPSNAAAGASITPAVAVTVEDAVGNTVTTSTAPVTIAIGTNPAGGTLSGTATVNAVSGVATFSNLSVNLVATGYSLTASSPGLTTAASGTFNITAGSAGKLAFGIQPSATTAGASITPAVTVTVEDSGGNPVTSSTAPITIGIGTNGGGGTLSGTLTVNAVSGVATFSNLSINNAGMGYTLSASSPGLIAANSTAFAINPGTANKLAFITPPSGGAAGASFNPVTVAIEDAGSNTVTSSTAPVTLAIGTNPSGGTLGGTLTVNAVNGVATFSNLSINLVGNGYTLTAASPGLAGTASGGFSITPGPANKLVFSSPPTSAGAGVIITPIVSVTVEDANGNTITTSTASISVAIGTNPSGGTLSGTITANAAGGVATFSNLSINNPGTGYTLTAASTGLIGAASGAFNITGGAPTQLVFGVQPSTTAAGASITPAVTVSIEDVGGNLTSSTASVTIAIGTNPSLGVLSGTTTVNAVNGVATFSGLSINKTGTGYALSAVSAGLSPAASGPFNITPGTASKLAFGVQPSNVATGSPITPAVTVLVEDANSNTVTSSTAAIAMAIGTNPASGTLSGTVTVNAAGGVATFSNLAINNLGNGYTLSASTAGLSSVTSTGFNVTGGAPNIPATTVGNNLVTSVSMTLPEAATVNTPTITITSNDTTHFLLSTSNTAIGTASVTVSLTPGSTNVPTFYLHGLGYSGTTAITATVGTVASGYANGSATMTLYPSGVVFYGEGPISTTTLSSPPTLGTVAVVVLNPGTLTLDTESQTVSAEAGAISYTASSGTPATGTVTGTPAQIPVGSWDVSSGLSFQPASPGTSTVTMAEPAGYSVSTQTNFLTTILVTVTGPTLSVTNTTVGNNLVTNMGVSFQTTPPVGTMMTITSNDVGGPHFLFSTSPTALGTASLTTSTSNTVYVHGENFGSSSTAITATVTVAATGFTSNTGTLSLFPSGVVFYGQGAINTTTFSSPTGMTTAVVVLSPGTLTLDTESETVSPEAGAISVSASSGTPATGTITGSPITIPVGSWDVSGIAFKPAAAGTSVLTLAEPAGYSVSTSASFLTTVNATVSAPTISVSNTTVGNNLVTSMSISFQSTPPVGTMMTITSNDVGGPHFLFSTSPTALGTASLTTSTTNFVYVHGENFGSSSTAITATVTVAATGFTSGTGTLSLFPSGVVFYGQGAINTTTLSLPTAMTTAVVVLTPGTLTLSTESQTVSPEAGAISVSVSSGTPATGTITGSPITIPVGSWDVSGIAFQPAAAGTSVLTLAEPAGYSVGTTASFTTTVNATVTAPTISVTNTTVGNELITNMGLSFQATPPVGTMMTISSGDSTHFLFSTNTTTIGSASITVPTSSTVYVQGQNFNNNPTAWTTTVTVSANGFTTGTATLTLLPSGVVFYSITSVDTTTTSPPTALETAIVVLNPGTLTLNTTGMNLGPQAVGGISYTVSSGTPATGGITGSPASIAVGSAFSTAISFQPLAAGSTILTITQPAGFNSGTSPSFSAEIPAVVNGP